MFVFFRWCLTCNRWKVELLSERRNHYHVNWKTTKSWEWPQNPDAIISVFLPRSWGGHTDIDDFSTSLNVWSNCGAFGIDSNVIKSVRGARNAQYGHNPNLKCTLADMTAAFDALRDLLGDQDLLRGCQANALNVNNILQDLQKIEHGDEQVACLNNLDEGLDAVIKHFRKQSVQNEKMISKLNTLLFLCAILMFGLLLYPFVVLLAPLLSDLVSQFIVPRKEPGDSRENISNGGSLNNFVSSLYCFREAITRIYLRNIFLYCVFSSLNNTWCWTADCKVLIHDYEAGMN